MPYSLAAAVAQMLERRVSDRKVNGFRFDSQFVSGSILLIFSIGTKQSTRSGGPT